MKSKTLNSMIMACAVALGLSISLIGSNVDAQTGRGRSQVVVDAQGYVVGVMSATQYAQLLDRLESATDQGTYLADATGGAVRLNLGAVRTEEREPDASAPQSGMTVRFSIRDNSATNDVRSAAIGRALVNAPVGCRLEMVIDGAVPRSAMNPRGSCSVGLQSNVTGTNAQCRARLNTGGQQAFGRTVATDSTCTR